MSAQQRKKPRESLQLQIANQRLRGLYAASGQLAGCMTEEDVYRITVQAAEEILEFTLCTLDMVEGDRLVVKATSTQVPPTESAESSLDEGLAGKTHRTGKTYVFGSLDEVPEALPTREDFRSGISTPIGGMGVFQVVSTRPNAFTEEDARSLELLLTHTREAIKRIRLQQQLREQAIRDPLTAAYNRRHSEEVIKQELARSKRYGHPIAFLMVDVNRFKEINDRFGHQAGDRVLQTVADVLLRSVRECDTVVRFGGDEFLVILPQTDERVDGAIERIRTALARRNAESPLVEFPVTLAVGADHWQPSDLRPIELVLSEADRRMYEDKARGRDADDLVPRVMESGPAEIAPLRARAGTARDAGALRELEAQFRHFIRRASDGIVLIQDGIVRFANPRLAELWGGRVEEVVGTPFVNYVHPDRQADVLDRYRRRTAGESVPQTYETVLIRKDGARVHAEVNAAAVVFGGRPADLVFIRDITERKQAEDALREKDRLLAESQRIANLGTWEADVAADRLRYSDQMYRIFGIQPEAFAHTTEGFLGLIHPDDRTAMAKWIEATLAGEKPGELDFRVVRPDKTVRQIRGRGEAVVDADGKVLGAVGTAQDLTEWKRAEEEREKAEGALREAVLREQAALEASILGLWDYYPQQNRVRLSDEWKQQLGYEPEELPDEYVEWSSRLHPDDAAGAMKRLADYIARGGDGEYFAEFRLRQKDGSYRWIQSHGRAVERADGRVTRVLGSHVDVTARKRGDEALQASEAEYRRLFERNMAGVYSSTLDGRIAACNQAFADLLGYDSPDDVMAAGASSLYFDDQDRTAFVSELSAAGEVKGRESCLRRKDGRPVWVIENAALIGTGSDATLQGTAVDVTQLREAQTALRERVKELTCLFHVNRELQKEHSVVDMARRVAELLAAGMQFPDKARVRVELAAERYKSEGYAEDLPLGIDADIRTAESVVGQLSVRYTDGQLFLPEEQDLVNTAAADLAMWHARILARERLKKALDGTVRAVGLVAEMKDSYTSGHQLRVAELASAIARRMGLLEKDVEDVRVASLIHDIGKMAVPAEILSKPSRLTDVEFSLIKEHPRIAYEMLTAVEFIEPVATIIVQHHERLDGSGYPHRLKGEAVTRAARILAVADVVEAMASHRPYRPALGIDAALGEIRDHKGDLYDPVVVNACVALFEERAFAFDE